VTNGFDPNSVVVPAGNSHDLFVGRTSGGLAFYLPFASAGDGLAWSAAYNGDGARLRQVTNGVPTTYTLDLAAPLVQVLAQQDGSGMTRYLYGVTRVGEQQLAGWVYHLPDALGSVRQLADGSAQVALARGYMPYGEVLWSAGEGDSKYGFTGEAFDASVGMVFLRARYYGPDTARFLSKDTWQGDYIRPRSFNGWSYVEGNPILLTDSSGREPEPPRIVPPDYGLGPFAMNGYIEGVSFSKTIVGQMIEYRGVEIVYDFVTHERMRFNYVGYWKEWCGESFSLGDATINIYAGWYGFQDRPIQEEYSGPFANFSSTAAAAIPLAQAALNRVQPVASIGGGWTAFCTASVDWTLVPGVDWPTTRCGVSLSVSMGAGFSFLKSGPFGASVYFTDYRPETSAQHYSSLEDMTRDILVGWSSPAWATSLLEIARQYAVDIAGDIWEWQSAYAARSATN